MAPTDLILKAPKWFKDILIVCMTAAVAFFGSQWLASRDVSHTTINGDIRILQSDIGDVKKQNQDQEVRLSVVERYLTSIDQKLDGTDKKLDRIINLHLKNGEKR